MDDVTIGRCSQYDNQNLQVDANDSEVLWQEATSLLPNLKKAQKGTIQVSKEVGGCSGQLLTFADKGVGGVGQMLT